MELKDKLLIIRDFANNKDTSKIKFKINKEDVAFFLAQSLYPLVPSFIDISTSDPKSAQRIKTLEKANIMKDDVQKREIDEICSLFEKNNIKMILLKGSVIKELYKESYLRTMGDIDIYVEKKDHKKATKLILSMGYKKDSNYGHHRSFIKIPFIELEMHRSLLSPSNKCNNIFKDVFSKCINYKNYKNIYVLNYTYFMLYEFTHTIKHYEIAGCGLRNLIDLYIFDKKYNESIDYKLINEIGKKYNIEENINAFTALSHDLFSYDMSIDDVLIKYKDNEIFNIFISSGIYGSKDRATKQKIVKKSRFRTIIKELFPSKNTMKDKYSALENHMWLVGFFYIFRLVKPVLHPIKTIRKIKLINKNSK